MDSPDDGPYKANENVRDLHRSLVIDRAKIPGSASVDGLKLPDQYRLQPEVGTASDLAQPGGFRRAHLDVKSDDPVPGDAYRATPLLTTLHQLGFTHSFVTRAVQRLEDGTELGFASRAYRRGALPTLLRTPRGLPPPKPRLEHLRFIGFKPLSVPYWVSVTFLLGAICFLFGSGAWFVMGETPAPLDMAIEVTYPYWVGSVLFLAGCYLAFVEVINANLEEDLRSGTLKIGGSFGAKPSSFLQSASEPLVAGEEAAAAGLGAPSGVAALSPASSLQGCLCRLHWWRFQPHSLLWWGALVQLVGAVFFQAACAAIHTRPFTLLASRSQAGAIFFEVACVAGLPAVTALYALDEDWWVNGPCVIGSACFTFASYVYLLEVAPLVGSPWTPPASLRERLGYVLALCNLLGSFLFLIASGFYFVHRWPAVSPAEEWEFLASEWGVRFGFGAGSAFFIAGALFSFPEVLSDDVK